MKHVLPGVNCLACPIDGQPLDFTEKGTLVCPQNHTYDRAKQGYFNLLPVQFKPSRDPGDSKEMIAARQRVLAQGIFENLSNAMTEIVCECAQSLDQTDRSAELLLIDAGCGEGYYTSRMANALSSWSNLHVLGIDISKWGILTAAKAHKNMTWAVANNKRLPIQTGTAHVITSLFGFETWPPWSALQTTGQWVVTVDAASDHLLELRELIYPNVEKHDAPDDSGALKAGYEKTDEVSLKYQINQPSSEALTDIVYMTPHGKKITLTTEASQTELSLPQLTIDTLVRIYKKP